ncbi:MAG: hypothetical protein ACOZCP_17665 [Pseudomonadota bacterium]
MATIIAGRFDTLDTAREAARLLAARLGQEHVEVFYNGPAGQHATYPIGGDQDQDPGASKSDSGAAAGALAAGPIGAAAGAGVGAYTGALVGAVKGAKGATEPGSTVRRRAGMMVAAHLPNTDAEQDVIGLLRRQGADEIETAQGEWRDGKWADFDPAAAPRFAP